MDEYAEAILAELQARADNATAATGNLYFDVTYHSLVMDCGDKLMSLVGEANAERFTAFDELCTSERSVDPMVFLDAIANARCKFYAFLNVL